MNITKEWNWEKNDDDKWLIPSEEIYYLNNRWKKLNFNKFLDLGCGLGRHSLYMAENGFDVTAFDLSEYGLNNLKELSKAKNLQINTVCGNMLELPFKDDTFDAIMSYQVIYHTDTNNFIKALNEVKRVLKKNGEFFVTMISKNSESFKNSSKHEKLDENTIMINNAKTENNVPHMYVNIDDIKNIFEKWKFLEAPKEIRVYDFKILKYLNAHWNILIQKI